MEVQSRLGAGRPGTLKSIGIKPGRRVRYCARMVDRHRVEEGRYLLCESLCKVVRASCTVVMNWAGKMMVEFFSVAISAIV